MKQVEIKLKNKRTGIIQTLLCHHYSADSRAYYLYGVKGHKDYGFGISFNKAEWKRI